VCLLFIYRNPLELLIYGSVWIFEGCPLSFLLSSWTAILDSLGFCQVLHLGAQSARSWHVGINTWQVLMGQEIC